MSGRPISYIAKIECEHNLHIFLQIEYQGTEVLVKGLGEEGDEWVDTHTAEDEAALTSQVTSLTLDDASAAAPKAT